MIIIREIKGTGLIYFPKMRIGDGSQRGFRFFSSWMRAGQHLARQVIIVTKR